jgi:hypothetical protein
MRWLPKAIPVLIAIIALDFALVFGFEAWRIFTSPIYGLDQLVFANLVHGIAGLAGSKHWLFNIAAFFGAVYLTIAIVLTIHLASRIGALRGGRISHDLLDAGLILIVLATIVVATPAILKGASEILVQERLPLWLVGLAATLSMIERLPDADTRRPGYVERLWLRFAARRKRDDMSVVTPAIRSDAKAASRWDDLRSEAGMVLQPAPVVKSAGPWYWIHARH